MNKTFTLQDFCKRRKITPEWLASECGSLDLDADKSQLPDDELIVGGDLVIKSKDGCTLPPVIRVGGDLTLRGAGITDLPERLEVGRTLIMNDTSVRVFHKDCKVNGLNVKKSPIERFPDDWTVDGSVLFENCPLLKLPDGMDVRRLTIKKCLISTLPKRLKVREELDMNGSFIREIPGDSQIGTLYAMETPLVTLPNDWGVDGSLILEGSSIKRLPKGLHVGKVLDISRTAIRVIPADCLVGALYACDSCLEQLPNDWSVAGSVTLDGCFMFKRLPNRLKCGDRLDISRTSIAVIPDDCSVRELHASDSALEKLPDNWSVDGSLIVSNCRNFRKLPRNLHVGEILEMANTPIQEIGDDCRFGGLNADHSGLLRLPDSLNLRLSLNISRTHVRALPTKLFVGRSLFASDSDLESLPNNLVVGTALYLIRTRVSEIPSDLVVGLLYLNQCPVQRIPKEVIAGRISCDQSVLDESYRFQNPVLDVHPNGRFATFENQLYRLVENQDNCLKFTDIGSGDALYLVTDGNGCVGSSSSLPVAKADLLYVTQKSKDFVKYRKAGLNTLLPLEVLLYCMLCSGFSKKTIEQWLNGLVSVKESYTIGEFIQLTEGLTKHPIFKSQFSEA